MQQVDDVRDYTKDWNQVLDKPNLRAYNEKRNALGADTRTRRQRRNQLPKTHPVSPKPKNKRHRANILTVHEDTAKKASVRSKKKAARG